MASADDILVDNLVDALQQIQRYLLLGATSAALLVFITIESTGLLETKAKVDVPNLGKLDPGIAAIAFFVGFLAFGILANSALNRAKQLRGAIKDPDLAEAALLRFSFATANSSIVRVGTALVPALLLVVGYLIEFNRGAAFQVSAERISYQILGFVAVCTPYFMLAAGLLSPLTSGGLNGVHAENATSKRPSIRHDDP